MIDQMRTLLAEISFKIQGDCGPLSTYTNQNGKVIFLKAWLRDPASPAQIAHRDKIRLAGRTWKMLQPSTRENWELVTKRLSLKINGYNLWVSYVLETTTRSDLETLTRQSGIPLWPPT